MVKGLSFLLICLIILGQLFIAGCVTTPEVKQDNRLVFYPEPPELPRYQFLRSFKGGGDFQEKKSGLDQFLGGSGGSGYSLVKPFGVIMQQGSVYVVDTQATVFKLDLVNNKFSALRGAKGLGKLVAPINISKDDAGNKYVCDPVRRQVIMYDRNDFYVKSFSNPKTWKPVDAEVYEDRLFVADSTNHKGGLVVFDLESGEIVGEIGSSGPREQRVKIAVSMSIDDEGYLYIMDAGRFQITKFDRDGHYRGHLGEAGDTPGRFGRPRGIDIDRQGRIYAVDAAYDVVQVFAPSGQVLAFFGGTGTKPGSLTLPAGVFLDYDPQHIKLFNDYIAEDFEVEYLILVTSQFNNNSALNIYGYGKKRGESYPSDQALYQEKLEKIKLESEVK